MLAKDNKKKCSSCKKVLSLSSFNSHKRTGDKLQNVCKSCKARMTKNWKYTLKSGQFDEMVKIQNSCCVICHLPQEELVIDHDHKTNKLRSLLCRKCNALLGMCDDNLIILESAISYIKRWTEE